MQAKLERIGPQPLIGDYEPFMDRLPGSIEGLINEVHEALKLTGEALRLSAHILARDTDQLAPQLTGRLLGMQETRIKTILSQIRQAHRTPWLRPITPSLHSTRWATYPNTFRTYGRGQRRRGDPGRTAGNLRIK